MTKYPNPIPGDLLPLIDDIYQAKILLPDFQRGFDWNNKGVIDLLVSLLSGYFIGTFLVQRRGNGFDFAIRYFEGVPDVNSSLPSDPNTKIVEENVTQVVLDGQQRLTALFYALYHPKNVKPKNASHPYRYFVKLHTILGGAAWSDSVIWSISEVDAKKNLEIDIGKGSGKKHSFKELIEWAGSFQDLLEKHQFKNYCYENDTIPFSTLRNYKTLDSWLTDYLRYHLKKKKGSNLAWDEYTNKQAKIKDLFADWLNFRVPIVPLENRPLSEVAEIFERINRTGTELSVFSLANAVFFKQKCNLREWWKKYFQESSRVAEYCGDLSKEDYPKYILQIIALCHGKEVKKSVLISPSELLTSVVNYESAHQQSLFLEEEQLLTNTQKEISLRNAWDEACNLLDKALERIEDTTSGYGVIKPNLLPYKPIIVTLAALLNLCKTSEHYQKVDAWYWSSVFTERYGGSSDTAIKQDFDQVKKWFKDNSQEPEVVQEAKELLREDENRISPFNLEKLESRGALYKSIVNLVALKRPRDFFKGQSITLEILDDHHLFPKGCGITMKNENSILNSTLISSETNKKISKKRPSIYLKQMIDALGNEEEVKNVLESHFIDEYAIKAMKQDDYSGFLSAREAVIKSEMRKRIAYIPPSNGIAQK